MKILVTVKRVMDYESKLKIRADGQWMDTEGANMVMNPFDEIAVEEALRLQEKHQGEVVVVSIGPADAMQQIRSALAMGADRGILLVTNQILDCMAIAKALKHIVEQEKPDLILMGKQAVDDDSHQVGEMLAEMLGYGQAMQANTITLSGNAIRVACEADGGLYVVDVDLPCVVTTDLRLNEPRYASLPGIMKAKKKPVDERSLETLGIELSPKVKLQKLEFPPKRKSAQIVPDVATLFSKLKQEAKVL